MAAAMNSCMRTKVIRFSGLLRSERHHFSLFSAKTNTPYHIVSVLPNYSYSNLTLLCKRHFSEKVKGTLTDDILKDRLANQQPEDKRDDSQTKDENTDSKSQSKSKGFNIFGRFVSVTTFGFWIFGLMLTSTGISAVMIMGEPQMDDKGRVIEDEFSQYPAAIAYLKRAYKEAFVQVKVTKEPSRTKLLPEPLTYPYYQPPYTLVLEMTNILVHPEWTYGTGWRFKKRPGIDHFLRTVGPPMFEVVVFTKEQGMTADPIITKIDPENFVMYRLYRDATRYEDGLHIKDLNYLNRDLSKVIIIDWNKDAYKLNPDNGFRLKPWKGEEDDVVLGELADFLRALAVSKVDDVRPVLQYYSQFDDPLAQFHENQLKLKEEQERQAQVAQQRGQKNLGSSVWGKFKL